MDGQPVWENPALKARIATIPDDWYYFIQASVRDMMHMYRGFYPRFSMERYEKLREVFSLDERKAIRRLSKGMQKQAAFWLALSLHARRYLLLDEPVDGLDPVMRRQMWSLLLADVGECGARRCWSRRTTCGSWRTSATASACCTAARRCSSASLSQLQDDIW
jgi:ABC-2 type transport system ATP-binding protein